MNLPTTIPPDLLQIDGAGLKFTRPPTLEEWQGTHSFLLTCRRASLRWIADSRRVGRNEFGEAAVDRLEEQMMLDLGDGRAATALEALPAREPGLNDHHMLVLAKLKEQPDEFARWADAAKEHQLSPRDLARSIHAGTVQKGKSASLNADDKSVGIVSIEGISLQFEMWQNKARTGGFPEQWDTPRLLRIQKFLWPFCQAMKAVESALKEREAK